MMIAKEALPLFLALSCIYLTSLYGYLLFHALAEGFSIVIACGIFMVAWNARRFLQNHYLLFIGIAYLFVGGIDFLHMLAFKGMGVFTGFDANLPTQLWIAARYMEALSLLLANCYLKKKLSPHRVFAGYATVTALLLFSIFYRAFPDCYIEGTGLTPFKIVSEYIICLILLASIGILLKNRKEFDESVLTLIIASIASAILSELSFTAYLSVYGFSNMLGHFFKIITFYLIYKAIIETSLVSPYDLLFRNLKQSEERFRFLFEDAPTPYQSLDDQGRIVSVNHKWLETLGLLREEVVGRWFGDFLTPQSRKIFEEKLASFRDEGQARGIEFEMVRGDGSLMLVSLDAKTGRDEKGCFSQTHCVFSDITERRRMEEELRKAHDLLEIRVRERTAELERVNRDLADFNHIAAHDLQEPLRLLITLGDRLASKCACRLDLQDRYYIDRIQTLAQRASTLTRDILCYSMLSSRTDAFAPADFNGIIWDALARLEQDIARKEAVIDIGDFPIIEADPGQMTTVFANLVSNSLKFAGDEKPKIRIHGEPSADGRYNVFVEDNGIGFDEAFLEKIFTPFQRLHSRSRYEGNGIGLAICRKVLEMHGGSITARSTPNAGATFILTLPINQMGAV